MARAGDIRVEGLILAWLPKGRCRVALSNGHQLIAWRRHGDRTALPAVGTSVELEVSPCDLSQGRLVQTKRNLAQ
jgi:translation initiation factor IF-1